MNGYDAAVKPIEHNIDKAKELLKEAGYEGGFSTTIWTNDNPERIKIAEYVQSKLKELNVEVKIEVVEWEHIWPKPQKANMICLFSDGPR